MTNQGCILFVDDEEPIRSCFGRVLVQAGYQVVEAGHGMDALERMEKALPDLAVIDLIMPVMEGIETIVEMRRRHPGIRILAISGGGRVEPGEYLCMAERLGAVSVLAKPFSAQEMLRTVKATLAAQPPPCSVNA